MFLRLVRESFVRQRRRKALAGAAILLGTTAVTAMLALATTIGDRIHRELAVYGANIVVTPRADALSVKVGGVDLKPATGGAYLHEADLEKLKGIFWANNITGVSPELTIHLYTDKQINDREALNASARGLWFDHAFGTGSATTGVLQLHPLWKVDGKWPSSASVGNQGSEIALTRNLASRAGVRAGDFLVTSLPYAGMGVPPMVPLAYTLKVTGIVEAEGEFFLLPLRAAQILANKPGAISRVDVSAKTRPEDALARMDAEKLSPKQHDLWYCRPYANSIAYQIMEAIPGSRAEQVRKVEQSEGNILARISGLMWLVSGAALLAAGFAVSAAMATAVLERRGEIGLMRSLGASRAAIALLFYAESGLLAVAAGVVGFCAGSGLAWWLGGRVFAGSSGAAVLNWALLPVVVGLALAVAVAGSTPSIRAALRTEPSAVLRGGG